MLVAEGPGNASSRYRHCDLPLLTCAKVIGLHADYLDRSLFGPREVILAETPTGE